MINQSKLPVNSFLRVEEDYSVRKPGESYAPLEEK